MLKRLTSTFPTFKSFDFHTGLNLIFGGMSSQGRGNTVNGVGKSTVFELVDYLLGGSHFTVPSVLVNEFEPYTVTLDLQLAGKDYSVTRPLLPGKAGEEVTFAVNGGTRESLTLAKWRAHLDKTAFYLDDSAPTFRTIFPYFWRFTRDSVVKPIRIVPRRDDLDDEICASFLVRHNWQGFIAKKTLVKKRKKAKADFSAIKRRLPGRSSAALDTTIVSMESSILARKSQLEDFKAQLHYEQINKEVDRLTQDLHRIQEQTQDLQSKIRSYEEALESEEPPEPIDLSRVYKSAGIIFPKEVKVTLEQARRFHSQILIDRRAFLQSEIDALSNQVQELVNSSRQKDEERSDLLQVLRKEEAWPEYQELLNRNQREIAELEYFLKLRADYQETELELMRIESQIDAQRKSLYADFIGRVKSRTFLQQTYGKLISSVYESKAQGTLKIDGDGGGLEVEPIIKGAASQTLGGKPNVALVALMLAVDCLWAQSKQGLGLQGFDNFLLSGVDSRQVPTILRRGAELAAQYGFQLICGVNYDDLGADATEEFDQLGYFALKLSDRDASGKLFGVEW